MVCWWPLAVCAATDPALAFDLPRGDAAETLKRAARIGSVQVMFVMSTVSGVKTNAVRGRFPVRDALDRMVANTGLVVVWDARVSAFSIERTTAPSGRDPTTPKEKPAGPPPKTSTQTKPMKTRSLFALLFALPPLGAQTTGAPAAPDPKPAEAVVLSPFTVTTEKDTGYAATNTLAGTRLNTPVKDLGASLSIYTKDFLEDVGATNANELLVFATGMEAAGPGGNYSGAAGSINADQVVGEESRSNPQGTTRTRGLASPNYTRGFYGTDVAFDAYNTDAVTINRGPNAILFGVGSPAGVVDTTLIRPDLNRHRSKVETRFGNNVSLRGVLDLNRVLIPGKLAVRLAALHDREEYNQRPAYEEKRRLYGAATWEPFKSTSVRANFETGRTRANRPLSVLPFKSINSYWEAAGRPGYDWTFYDDPARNPAAAAQNAANFQGFLIGQAQLFDQIAVVYDRADATAPAYAFRAVTQSTTGNGANAVRADLFHPTLNRDRAADGIQFVGTRNIATIPAGFFTGANVFPGQLPGFAPAGIKMQGFTDYRAFDFENRLLDETSFQGDSFRTFNIALEQRALGDRIGVEVAYDTQRLDRRAKNSFFSAGNANHIYLDVNAVLPTGERNPNYGRPYALYGQSTWSNNYSQRETWRVTPFARYDFKELGGSWTKWLGRHTVTGLYEENAVETIGYSHRLASDGEAAAAINPNIVVFARRPGVLVYVGPSIIGNNNPLTLEPIRVPELTASSTLQATYFSRAANATDPGSVVTRPASLVEINTGGSAQREVIKSQAAVLQSYWLLDHLVTVVGWRRDEDYFARRTINTGSPNFNAPSTAINDPGKVHYGFGDLTFARTPPPNVAKEIKSYSGVLKWPKRLVALPRGTDFSVFYNVSENFTPAGGRVDSYNNALASPEGETQEHGFNLSLFNDKLSLRFNRFKTQVRGQSAGNAAFGQANNNATVQLASFWATEANRNPENVPFMNAAIERLFSVLPANYRALRGFSVVGTAPNVSATFTNLPGTTDTTDFTATGSEIEVVYNPTSNWRILANVAKQETVQINAFPGTKEFVARMLPIWTSNLTDPRTGTVVNLGDIPRAGYGIGFGPANPPDATAERTSVWLDRDVLVPFATAIAQEGSASAEQRKWRVNLVTNYRFGRGSIFGERLKGWSVGGAVRWQDKLGIGYPTTRNANGSVTIDIKRPYYAPAETNVDGWVGYTRKIFNGRIEWRAQLNVRNLVADDSPIAITVQPWGEVATTRLPPERRFYLTNTFSF
jgi:hypothetical protein